VPASDPTPSPTLELLEKIQSAAPKDDPRLQNYIAMLRDSLRTEQEANAGMKEQLSQYEEAYEKLTSPANRIGTFLDWLDEENRLALIVVGDQEFVAVVDPKHEGVLLAGDRVKVNEAYAVVGSLPPADGGGIVKIGEALPDGRLRLGGDTPGAATRIIVRSAELRDVDLKAGDEVRIDASGRIALERFEQRESRDYFLEEVPELPWEKVGGQQEAIRLIRDTIELPLLHPEVFAAYDQKPIKGILLYGPPGCGKTLIGKATAYNLAREYSEQTGREVQEYFMAISGPKILNMWLGETERMVREIFRTARDKAKEGKLVFIFMDEAESVLRTRSSGRYLNISNTVVPQFCAELDGLQTLENVVLILTSNRPDYIDPAVLRPGRIDRKVKVMRPDRASAEQILGIYLHSGIPLDPEVLARWNGEVDCARKALIEGTVEFLWSKSRDQEFLKVMLRNGSSETLYQKDLISGALLKSIVDRAKDAAIQRAIADKGTPTGIGLEDLIAATRREFRENEIFPKSDTMEDWLQLLDYAPENVASVKPIGVSRGEEYSRKAIL